MKLTVGDDLRPLYDLIFRVKRNHPQQVQNLRRIIANVDRYIDLYKDHLAMHRRTNKPIYLERAQDTLDELCQLLTVLERVEIMNYLSRS